LGKTRDIQFTNKCGAPKSWMTELKAQPSFCVRGWCPSLPEKTRPARALIKMILSRVSGRRPLSHRLCRGGRPLDRSGCPTLYALRRTAEGLTITTQQAALVTGSIRWISCRSAVICRKQQLLSLRTVQFRKGNQSETEASDSTEFN
jgi:hypothetical protein